MILGSAQHKKLRDLASEFSAPKPLDEMELKVG